MIGATALLRAGVRQAFSALVLSSFLWLSLAPLAATLAGGQSHRCSCCPKGRCGCCKRLSRLAGGPSVVAKSACRSGCGCAGVLTAPIALRYPLAPARQTAVRPDSTVLILCSRTAAVPAAAPIDSLHQRPPPILPA